MNIEGLATKVIEHANEDLEESKNLIELEDNYKFFNSWVFDVWCEIGNVGHSTKNIIKKAVTKKYIILKKIFNVFKTIDKITNVHKGNIISDICHKRLYLTIQEKSDIIRYIHITTIKGKEILSLNYEQIKKGDELMECKNGIENMKYDVLSALCSECNFINQCKGEKKKMAEEKAEKKEKKGATIIKPLSTSELVEKIDEVHSGLAITPEHVSGYRNISTSIKEIFKLYSDAGCGRKRAGHKDRMKEIRSVMKKLAKCSNEPDEKIDYLFGLTRFVYFG